MRGNDISSGDIEKQSAAAGGSEKLRQRLRGGCIRSRATGKENENLAAPNGALLGKSFTRAAFPARSSPSHS